MLRWFCFSVVLIGVFALGVNAQTSRSPASSPGPSVYVPSAADSPGSLPPGFQQQAQAKQNEDRQTAMKRDADRLFAMASELKQNVDRTNGNILSLDVIKKAQAIEKLAKSVREKMKGD